MYTYPTLEWEVSDVYRIFADSSCDMPPEVLEKWGVSTVNLTFHFEGEEREYANNQMTFGDFYKRLREGAVAKTSAANEAAFKAAFEPVLQAGEDILYVAFSSGLSTTCQSGAIAAEELTEQYPDRKIRVVDSLCASGGYGLLVYLAVQRREAGETLEQVAQYVLDTRLHLAHWFTVEDLQFLKRGGRVSAAAALLGGLLGIKPVMHVDDEGKLTVVTKVRGRRTSLQAMADKIGEMGLDPTKGPIFITHGDCMGDVEILKKMIKDKYGLGVDIVSYVGTVIGAHSGPGTMALFFLAKER